jgi:hypothetical protein
LNNLNNIWWGAQIITLLAEVLIILIFM